MTDAIVEANSESGFYNVLKDYSCGWWYFERIEPANESGFPDIYFTARYDDRGEGTIELKFFKPNEKVSLQGSKVRGTQKSALMDYYEASGKRRFFLAWKDGVVYAWDTANAVKAMMGKSHECRTFTFEGFQKGSAEFGKWLMEILG